MRPDCTRCDRDDALVDFTFAFQPILDITSNTVFSYEALVRGVEGQGAPWVLSHISESNRHAFDQQCRSKALSLASAFNVGPRININFMPDAVYEPQRCIQSTLAIAEELGTPLSSIVFEVSEQYSVEDRQRLVMIFESYREIGLKTAIDDFGAGYSGLGLLAEFQPDFVKIDMSLVRDIHDNRIKRTIVEGVTSMCNALGITVIAEGVESQDEVDAIAAMGVSLFQGFHFGRPAMPEALQLPA